METDPVWLGLDMYHGAWIFVNGNLHGKRTVNEFQLVVEP